ncbi:MAG: signal peptidase I [Candidatus Ryanbacteria bacterium RIFCSPHIGHO2_02_FULL_45_17b]|uniref:Signal peptidase I n=1 Tax=Candidatus Ryanbacteria bacterium RIFCSPHIGHO2_01_FULL_45_22 TaxID=1802114 RepID=A0A1G2G0E4_9BACT|nr:MAG: signal peptidase I [Candidatus Ryanbacteria bacterium RIFCSPHIGHO2_01_FULL_45_22]OGZ47440.1 MAG: signal peptidase I [Candidatus Ryanbacteria bacterium RIFCSPHIGHO2_02_FULL_45_17b]
MKTFLKFVLNLVIYVGIVVGVLIGMPRFLAWKLETPYPLAAITSGSMWPALHEGDLIFIEGVDRSELAVGDIVVWRNPGGFTIHRVTKRNETTLITKGDANFTEDEPVKYEDVIGRTYQVFGKNARVPFLGMISVYANKK